MAKINTDDARIYLDYAAATPVCKEARKAQRQAEALVGNPGAIHAEGVAAKQALERARADIAKNLGCRAGEVTFTAGGTEANNLAILGYARALEHRGVALTDTHWITTAIEHPSVLAPFQELERRGALVSYVQPSENGEIRSDAVAALLQENTVFVSIGWANGEIGTVQPLHAIAKTLHNFDHGDTVVKRVVLHSDAGQAPLYFPSQVSGLGVHMLTLDSSKLYGPRGTAALYSARECELAPILFGGSQERGLRPGSESVASAAGFAAAFNVAAHEREQEHERLAKLRKEFIDALQKQIPDAVVNGTNDMQLPNIVNLSIPDIHSEYVTLALDHRGVAISTKSACREGEEQRSHVVAALGGDMSSRAENTLRFSFGRETAAGAIMQAVQELVAVVNEHRREA